MEKVLEGQNKHDFSVQTKTLKSGRYRLVFVAVEYTEYKQDDVLNEDLLLTVDDFVVLDEKDDPALQFVNLTAPAYLERHEVVLFSESFYCSVRTRKQLEKCFQKVMQQFFQYLENQDFPKIMMQNWLLLHLK